jgi:ketosteroid isomerase-like protein
LIRHGVQERIEIVRVAVASLNRGDWDAALELLAPDFEYDLSRTVSPLQGVYGRDQIRKVVEEFLGPWEAVLYEADELIEAGEQVVMPFTTYFRGRDGIEVEARATWVWTVREGTVIRLVLYQDQAEALEAAGLRDRRS